MSEVAEPSLADAMSKVPSSYEPQKKADFKHITAVYKKFWSECEDAYIFGVDEKKELSIDKMVDAPAEYNILSREDNVRYFYSQQALRLFLTFESVQEVW